MLTNLWWLINCDCCLLYTSSFGLWEPAGDQAVDKSKIDLIHVPGAVSYTHLIMLIGHLIEMKAIMGAGDALKDLASLVPKKAHLKSCLLYTSAYCIL